MDFGFHYINYLLKDLYDAKPGQERLFGNLIALSGEMSTQVTRSLSVYYNEQRFNGFYLLTTFFVEALEKLWYEEFPDEILGENYYGEFFYFIRENNEWRKKKGKPTHQQKRHKEEERDVNFS